MSPTLRSPKLALFALAACLAASCAIPAAVLAQDSPPAATGTAWTPASASQPSAGSSVASMPTSDTPAPAPDVMAGLEATAELKEEEAEAERVLEYQRLLAGGLSDAEARETVWPAPPPPVPPSSQLVDVWFAHHFHGMGARLSTEVHNILYAAVEELKALLLELPLS